MINSNDVKQFLTKDCGVDLVGIAPATPFTEKEKSQFKKTNDVLRANPLISDSTLYDAEDFVEGAKSVIVCATNAYFGVSPLREGIRSDNPRGEIGNFYLNFKIINKAQERGSILSKYLATHGYKSDSPFAGFGMKIKGVQAGFGSTGKNTLIINKKFGTWFAVSTMITDAPLEPDISVEEDFCKTCTKCIDACPTQALKEIETNEGLKYSMDVAKCLTFQTCHFKGEIKEDYRIKIGNMVGNCTICSDVCPYNQNLTINTEDKLPDEIVYPELLPLLNITEDEYDKRYATQMFGMIIGARSVFRRNVAIALGNVGKETSLRELNIAKNDSDHLVKEHAEWAIESIKSTV